MTATIDILVPTLWRSERLPGLVANIHDATECEHLVTFVIEQDDYASWNMIETLIAGDARVRRLVNDRAMNLPGAINSAVPHVSAPWWFLGNDDVVFFAGWDAAALAMLVDHPEACLIGTNDLHNPFVTAGVMATMPLVRTAYIAEFGGVIDAEPGVAVCEEYMHNGIDVELTETARQRGVWQPCLAAVVEHRHWSFGFGERDATYEKSWQDGLVSSHDVATWARRRRLYKAPMFP